MDKNFWKGLVVGILIVVGGLLVFGDRINAPVANDEQLRSLNKNSDNENASSTEESDGGTIWNEFDGEIGI